MIMASWRHLGQLDHWLVGYVMTSSLSMHMQHFSTKTSISNCAIAHHWRVVAPSNLHRILLKRLSTGWSKKIWDQKSCHIPLIYEYFPNFLGLSASLSHLVLHTGHNVWKENILRLNVWQIDLGLTIFRLRFSIWPHMLLSWVPLIILRALKWKHQSLRWS